jgi:hypothetical protein
MSRVFQDLLATDRVLRVFSVSRIVHPVIFDVLGMAGGTSAFHPRPSVDFDDHPNGRPGTIPDSYPRPAWSAGSALDFGREFG